MPFDILWWSWIIFQETGPIVVAFLADSLQELFISGGKSYGAIRCHSLGDPWVSSRAATQSGSWSRLRSPYKLMKKKVPLETHSPIHVVKMTGSQRRLEKCWKCLDGFAQGCCEGVVFKAQTQGCCQGRIYTSAAWFECVTTLSNFMSTRSFLFASKLSHTMSHLLSTFRL